MQRRDLFAAQMHPILLLRTYGYFGFSRTFIVTVDSVYLVQAQILIET